MFDFQDFKESPLMLTMAAVIIGFVVVESLFFMVKAWKRGKEIGMTTEQLKNTVVSSALFSFAPAVSILATVVVLASSLGIVLPWIRLSVVCTVNLTLFIKLGEYTTVLCIKSIIEPEGQNIFCKNFSVTHSKNLSSVYDKSVTIFFIPA